MVLFKRPLKENNIIYLEGEKTGFVTSTTKSYNLNKFISIGYLNKDIQLNKTEYPFYTLIKGKKVEIESVNYHLLKQNIIDERKNDLNKY